MGHADEQSRWSGSGVPVESTDVGRLPLDAWQQGALVGRLPPAASGPRGLLVHRRQPPADVSPRCVRPGGLQCHCRQPARREILHAHIGRVRGRGLLRRRARGRAPAGLVVVAHALCAAGLGAGRPRLGHAEHPRAALPKSRRALRRPHGHVQAKEGLHGDNGDAPGPRLRRRVPRGLRWRGAVEEVAVRRGIDVWRSLWRWERRRRSRLGGALGGRRRQRRRGQQQRRRRNGRGAVADGRAGARGIHGREGRLHEHPRQPPRSALL
mmetsp:Transcript_176580/g.566171  ORF Transcript_176580/g.566171 Transcript_176580/m.566171 type:complete len:267 (+) Transcript_176580:118-918(+)